MLVVIVEVFNIQAGSSGSLLLELRKKQDWVIVFSTRQNIVWLEMDGRVFLMPLETKGKELLYFHSISFCPRTKEFALSCEEYGKGIFRIYIMKLNDRRLRQLVTVSSPTSISWSPDGSKLAFYENYHSTSKTMDLFLFDLSLKRKILICKKCIFAHALFPVSWAPDSKRFVFSFKNRSIVITTDLGKSFQELTKGDAPSWSPDGSMIVYRDGLSGIRLMNNVTEYFIDGHNYYTISLKDFSKRFLLNGKAGLWKWESNFSYQVVWSPDGKYILYYRFYEGLKYKHKANIYIMRISDKEQIKFASVLDMLPGQIVWIHK